MILLAVRTDAPTTSLSLIESDGAVLHDEQWQVGRQLAHDLLGKLETILHSQQKTWQDLDGLIVYRGPGSFTGLRIGITVMNTIAYAQHIPIVGVSGDEWQKQGAKRLSGGENDQVVLPEYGADARITKPRK
jgi:tRNA threonylcarbamoyladenosine biosynthesis protein TsaB